MLAISDIASACRQNHFASDTVRKGLDYAKRGRVLKKNIVIREDTLEVNALVQGSQSKPYKVMVAIDPDPDNSRRYLLGGECSCPMGYNCKHVVAAIAAAAGGDRPAANRTLGPLAEIEPTEITVPHQPLSYPLTNWVQQLHGLGNPPTTERVPGPERQLVFLLTSNGRPSEKPRLVLMTRPMKKSGHWGKPTHIPIRSEISAALLTSEPYAADAALLRELFGEYGRTGDFNFTSGYASTLLQKVIATGRCFWFPNFITSATIDEPLAFGEPRAAAPIWQECSDGSQQATFAITPPVTCVLALDPPWFIDAATNTAGFLQISGPSALAAHWLSAPAVPPEQSAALAQSVAQEGFPSPQPMEIVTRRRVRPTPVFRLEKAQWSKPAYCYGHGSHTKISELDIARVEFDYAGQRVTAGDNSRFLIQKSGNTLHRIERATDIERSRLEEAVDSGLEETDRMFGYSPPSEIRHAYTFTRPEDWVDWVATMLPEAQQHGWKVEIDPSFSYRQVNIDDWYSETTAPADAGNDWFAYELGIIVEGQRVNLLPMLGDILRALQAADPSSISTGDKLSIRLPDSRFVAIPVERLRAIAATLAEIFDPHALKDGRLEIGRLRAAELIDLHDTAPWRGPDDLKVLAQKIRSFAGIAPLPPPPSLNATLRPYQLEGLAWLQFLREHNFGGILADDMGLGKTVQALAHILAEKNAGRATGPSLVVAPTSLMPNWRAEAEKFTPDLKVLISHGNDRKEQFDNIQNHDLVVTSYALLPRDREILEKQNFHLLILDEAQYIKNPRTQWAEIARNLKSNHRLCMTGTPMENHLGELWSLMHFLSPGYLGPEKQFRKIYRDPIEKLGDTQRRAALAQRVRPFIMRRKKEDVAQDLPEKTEIIRNLELDGPQRDLYETIRLAMHEKVQQEVAKKGLSRAHIVILDALLKLRQVCCDPRLVKLERARSVKESAKLELLTEMLPELIAEGRKILLFSQFTSMLDLIEQAVNKLGIPFVRLTGDTTDRETPVKRFQAGEVPLFLISLKAGGTGLNLTAADTVIHYDPWWNPAVETQATDRAHRIGQTKKVFVYKLVTTGTVEEKILAMQQRKKELVAGLLADGAQQNLTLTQSDLNHLFDPL